LTSDNNGLQTCSTSNNHYWIDSILSSIVQEVIKLNPNASYSQIMGLLMKTLRGKVDGQILDIYVKNIMTLQKESKS
jgi:Glu-tRNA(Gln) amidotransferase subunit E-like FAD-binding protein